MIALADIEAARQRIAGAAIRTPLVRLPLADAPADVYLKLENLQPISSFKIRGATNAVRLAPPSATAGGLLTASALFCDSRESLRNEAGEFQLAVSEGLIPGEQHVRAELGEVLAGRAPGRRDDGELTLFRSLGVAIEDLAAAERAVTTARERGIGTEVDL